MITFWYTKVLLNYSPLTDVPDRYYKDVLDRLVLEGLYDDKGNKIVKQV